MISGSSWVLLYKDTLPDMVSVYKRKFCRFDTYSLCSRPLAVFEVVEVEELFASTETLILHNTGSVYFNWRCELNCKARLRTAGSG